jgi:hypothetical protein
MPILFSHTVNKRLNYRSSYVEKLMSLLLDVALHGLGIEEPLWRPIRPCKLLFSAASGN